MLKTTALDLNSDLGRRIERRLKEEQIIWLTTVGAPLENIASCS